MTDPDNGEEHVTDEEEGGGSVCFSEMNLSKSELILCIDYFLGWKEGVLRVWRLQLLGC